MTRFLKYCFAGMLISFFAACGGGGGSPGSPAGQNQTPSFFVNAPATLTLPAGQNVTYSIAGGKSPYFSSSSAPHLVSVKIEGASVTVSALQVGEADVRISSSGGAEEFSIKVSVVNTVTPFSLQMPDSVKLTIGRTADYPLIGGVPPYRANSTDETVMQVQIVNGSQLHVTALKKGSAKINVYDSDASKLSPVVRDVEVVESTPFLVSAPSSLSISRGQTLQFAVSGGTPAYKSLSSNSAVLQASIVGSTLTMQGVDSGSATVTVRDSSGNESNLSVNVSAPAPLTTTAPSTGLSMGVGTSRNFIVRGGTAPYEAPVSTNVSVATASWVGSALQIVGVAPGNATITVSDAATGVVSFQVNVASAKSFYTTAPSTGLVLGIGATRTFEVGGGLVPYKAPASTDSAVATATLIGNTLSLTGVAAGKAKVTLRDDSNTQLEVDVTVVAPVSVPFFTTAPPSGLVIRTGSFRDFELGGGALPYKSPISANASIAATTLENSNTLRITGLAAGPTKITVQDNAGASLEVDLVVQDEPVLPFFSTAPSAGLLLGVGLSRDFQVGGGTGSYLQPVSTNATVATAGIIGNTLQIVGVSVGNATISLRDSGGSTVSIAVVVGTQSPFFTTAPSTGLVLGINASRDFILNGGVAPYAAPVSTNEPVARAELVGANTVRISGVGTGTANIALRDSSGATLSVGVAVGASDALLTTAPAALTMEGGAVSRYEVLGGTGYSAESSNVSVATASIVSVPGADTRSTLTLTARANGTADIRIMDSRFRTLMLSVTVVNGSATGSVSSVELATDKLEIKSAGEEATITAFVKSAANVAMANVPVVFSANSGTLMSPDATTNASGVATVKLVPGGNKLNRSIAVIATAGTASGTVNVGVAGSSLTITGSSTQQLGARGSYNVRALDSSGTPLSGVVLSFFSTLGNSITPLTATTDASGNAPFSYLASNAGTDTLTVSGPGSMRQTIAVNTSAISLNITSPAPNTSVNVAPATERVTVDYLVGGTPQVGATVNFSTTRGSVSRFTALTDAAGRATVDVSSATAGPATVTAQIAGAGLVTLPLNFVATTPASINLQSSPSALPPNQAGSTIHQSTLTAIVRDASDNLVANQIVNFNLVNDLSGGSLSAGTAMTDSNGRASVQFIAGASSTPANGVRVRATVSGISHDALLTVNGSALFISFGISNEITNLDPTIYSKRFAVYVTDANGVAVGNQPVTLAAIPSRYRKGRLVFDDVNLNPGLWVYAAGSPTGICRNEDINGNGILDLAPASEDFNNDGRLTPGNVVVASPGSVTTDQSGRAYFDLQYGEQYVPWIDVRIVARATVAGTESRAETDFALVGDANDFTRPGIAPAGSVSPFGVNACNSPN